MNITTVRIEFDGGTPCNIPRLGYGLGYGSYRIDSAKIVRLQFYVPMSANVAEIMTLARAIEAVCNYHEPASTRLSIHGDSKIALNRCNSALKAKQKKKNNEAFSDACHILHTLCQQFAEVETHWRGRAASVKLFGH